MIVALVSGEITVTGPINSPLVLISLLTSTMPVPVMVVVVTGGIVVAVVAVVVVVLVVVVVGGAALVISTV